MGSSYLKAPGIFLDVKLVELAEGLQRNSFSDNNSQDIKFLSYILK